MVALTVSCLCLCLRLLRLQVNFRELCVGLNSVLLSHYVVYVFCCEIFCKLFGNCWRHERLIFGARQELRLERLGASVHVGVPYIKYVGCLF